ncbi:hypothetical protein D623_10035663 [Myotis brandtii]|uniref:Uncharacterized protein n=1 Tax=Myotis brandtii TaxID=109478 RepID=S7P654_MYOBR|nr:hypothetical protein D623_10035663 [Myotis brandtii]
MEKMHLKQYLRAAAFAKRLDCCFPAAKAQQQQQRSQREPPRQPRRRRHRHQRSFPSPQPDSTRTCALRPQPWTICQDYS